MQHPQQPLGFKLFACALSVSFLRCCSAMCIAECVGLCADTGKHSRLRRVHALRKFAGGFMLSDYNRLATNPVHA